MSTLPFSLCLSIYSSVSGVILIMGVANPRDAKTTPTDLIGAGSSKVEHRMSGDTQPLVFPPSRTCLW